MAKKSKVAEVASPVKDSGMDDWESKNHARTIMEAHEIMADPKKMKKVMKHFKDQKKHIKTVQDIVDYRNKKYGAGSDKEETSEGE